MADKDDFESIDGGKKGNGGDKIGDLIRRLTAPFRDNMARLWILGAALIIVILVFKSYTTLEPGQVAVRVNNITGAETTVTRPGLIMKLPFGIHSVFVIDASPQTFSMKGDANVDNLHVRELTVRASDGSNFVFKDTTLIFKIIGDEAETVLRNAGLGSAYLGWMRPLARSILRDEFGRESTISVSNPATFGEATERARSRINEHLGHHGLVVSKIVTPRPRFTEAYENLIEARNGAENQLSVIGSEIARAQTDRERTLAEVDRDQNRVIQEKRAALEGQLATAVAAQAETKREADTFLISQVGKGQAALSASAQRAAQLEGELSAEYEAKKAEITAFRTQPVERVMERLGERLKGVTIEIQPWANDSVPSRIEMEQVGGRK